METGMKWAVCAVGLGLLNILLGYIDKRFLASQIPRYPNIVGWFPGVANLTWLANITILPAVLYVIAPYNKQWDLWQSVMANAAALVAAIGMFWFYSKGPLKDMNVGAGSIRPAGVVLFSYTVYLIKALLLFYLSTDAERADVLVIGGLLMVYVPVANHLALHWLKLHYELAGWPDVLKDETRPLRLLLTGEAAVLVLTGFKLLLPHGWR